MLRATKKTPHNNASLINKTTEHIIDIELNSNRFTILKELRSVYFNNFFIKENIFTTKSQKYFTFILVLHTLKRSLVTYKIQHSYIYIFIYNL